MFIIYFYNGRLILLQKTVLKNSHPSVSKRTRVVSCYHLMFTGNSHCLPHRVRLSRYPCTR